jgi:hypothetical protein
MNAESGKPNMPQHNPASPEEVLMALNDLTEAALNAAAGHSLSEMAEKFLVARYEGALKKNLPEHGWKGSLRLNVLHVATHFGKFAACLADLDRVSVIDVEMAKVAVTVVEARCQLSPKEGFICSNLTPV